MTEKMTNTNQQTNTEKCKHATLWTISGTLESLRYLTYTAITGTILDYPDKDGNRPPATPKQIYELILEEVDFAIEQVNDLKRQIEVLAIHQEHRADANYLPLVD